VIHRLIAIDGPAGTGKTTELVNRILRILATGRTKVENIVAVTFTEKAAAELSARVRQGLHTAMNAAPNDVERRRLAEALRTLSQAHIETIHAFAASILRERPIEAGLDPGFDVLADLPAQLGHLRDLQAPVIDQDRALGPLERALELLQLFFLACSGTCHGQCLLSSVLVGPHPHSPALGGAARRRFTPSPRAGRRR